MLRFRAALAVTVALAAVSEAQFPARQPVAMTPSPLAVVLLPDIDDPIVVADLKLSEEQVKTLVARRQRVWDEAYTTAPKDLVGTATARTEATDALLKATLTPAQYQRAMQIAAQEVLRSGRGGTGLGPAFNLAQVTTTTLYRYPELAAAFKLTDEQKKEVAGITTPATVRRVARTIAMKSEQDAAAKEFLGTMLARWNMKSDPRLTNRRARPRDLSLLESKDVRADVKLTDDQVKGFAAVRAKWTTLDDDRITGGGQRGPVGRGRTDLSPKEVDDQAAALTAETEKLLVAILDPKQIARLKQLSFQQQNRGTHIEQLYKKDGVVRELAISDKQIKELDGLREAFEQDAAKAFEAGESFAPTEKRVKELVAVRLAKAGAVITAEQAAKLKTLIGELFTGSTVADSLRGPGFYDPSLPNAFRAAAFGTYSTEYNQLAANKSIHDELKMTAEQIKQAYETRDQLQRSFLARGGRGTDATVKLIAERSKAIEDALGKILTAEQAQRFREIMMQSRERSVSLAPLNTFNTFIASAVAYPGVAEAVKLTDEQRKQIFAGTAPAEVLTADQKAAIAKMLGEPFKGDFSLSPRGQTTPASTRQRTTLSATLRLFMARAGTARIEEALKLSPEQTKKIAAAREEYQKVGLAGLLRGGASDSSEAAKTLTAAIENFEKVVAGTFTADQTKRAAQLVVQSAAASSLVAMLTAPEMVKSLGLTTDQTAKLNALNEDAVNLQNLRVGAVVSDPEQKLALRLRDAADERMLAVLTDLQKAKWKDLTGEPWAGLRKTIPTRGPTRVTGGAPRGGFNQ